MAGRWRMAAFVLAPAIILAAACGAPGEAVAPEVTGSGEKPSPEQTEVRPATDLAGEPTRLAGTEWTLESLGGEALVEGTNITLDIGERSLGGFAGCNSYGMRYEATDEGRLRVQGLTMTLVGCPRAEGRQEKGYLDALQVADAYRMRDGSLEIQNAEGDITLVYTSRPQWNSNPADLAGTKWELRSTNGKQPPEDATPALSFESEKRYGGYDGCLRVTGTYTASRDDLTFTSSRVEGMSDCMKPEVLFARGSDIPEVAVGAGGDYRLSAKRLEIRTDAGEIFVFVPLREAIEERPGVGWTLVKFADGNEVTPLIEGTEITLKFDHGTLRSSGNINGSAGCNRYGLSYEHPIARNGPDRLDVGNPYVTKRRCSFPSGVMEQEQRYLEILADVSSYPSITIDGRMRLETADGRALVFSAPE